MRREMRSMLGLAVPVVLAELGWFAMSVVDMKMVGPLGPAAIGAVGLGSILFMTLMVFGMGTLLALDTYVSQSYGAGRIDECHRWLFAGIQLAAVISVVLMLAAWGGLAILPYCGIDPDVLAFLMPYTSGLVWSAPPLLFYVVCRRYLQAMNAVRPVMVALVAANVINLAGNWLLITGQWGFPALGIVGSAYATLAARIGLAVSLFLVILVRERRQPSGLHDVPFALDTGRVWKLFTLGIPAALQITLEVGVFAVAATMAGTIAPAAAAAYQIVLNIAGAIFMIPYGIGSASAVRVGHAVGRRDPHGVRLAGWAGLGLGSIVMVAAAVLFLVAPVPLLRVYTADASVIEVGVVLLFISAIFQLCDGLQTVATGALRGLGDTATPMYVNLAGHWLIGLPIGYTLCFYTGWGVAGLWTGLSVGLILIGAVLLGVWHARSRRFTVEPVPLVSTLEGKEIRTLEGREGRT